MKKEPWIKAVLTGILIPFTVKAFLRFTPLVTAISAIPVVQWLDKKLKLTPVLSKIISVLVLIALMAVSWHVAEVVVVLAAVAVASEVIHWAKVIGEKWNKYYGRQGLPAS